MIILAWIIAIALIATTVACAVTVAINVSDAWSEGRELDASFDDAFVALYDL